MPRELRALMSDTDAEETTRPDIPAALVEDHRSGFHQRAERELVPYTSVPVLTARFNEATVPDAALRISMAAAPTPEHHTPSGPTVPPPSGTRQQIPSPSPPRAALSTVPPPARERAKAPSTVDVGRAAEPSRQTAETWRRKADPSRRIPTPLPSLAPAPLSSLPPPPEKRLRAYLLVVVTAVLAALVGVGLGNGSLVRFGGRLHTAFVGPDDAPGPLAPTPAVRTRPLSSLPTQPTSPLQPAGRAGAADEIPKVPVLSVAELPPTEHDAQPAEPKPSASTRVRRAPRR
jgi:hypothetical protein